MLSTIVTSLAETLTARGLKLAVAESCTGGGVAYALTRLPGSSAWFERGFVTYSNEAKQSMLGVPATILQQCGAVSGETAKAMAEGALAYSEAQITLAVTGIAGPEGGSREKPVGLVWFAWAFEGRETVVKRYRFSGDRTAIREQAIEYALSQLLSFVAMPNSANA